MSHAQSIRLSNEYVSDNMGYKSEHLWINHLYVTVEKRHFLKIMSIIKTAGMHRQTSV